MFNLNLKRSGYDKPDAQPAHQFEKPGAQPERTRRFDVAYQFHLMPGTAAFVHGEFDFIPGLAGAFLNSADQFVLFALDELKVVVCELCELLFQFALGDIPVSFDS
jgi:hypothetical protein